MFAIFHEANAFKGRGASSNAFLEGKKINEQVNVEFAGKVKVGFIGVVEVSGKIDVGVGKSKVGITDTVFVVAEVGDDEILI